MHLHRYFVSNYERMSPVFEINIRVTKKAVILVSPKSLLSSAYSDSHKVPICDKKAPIHGTLWILNSVLSTRTYSAISLRGSGWDRLSRHKELLGTHAAQSRIPDLIKKWNHKHALSLQNTPQNRASKRRRAESSGTTLPESTPVLF